MSRLRDKVLEVAQKHPGLTDREITTSLRGRGAVQQPINQAARSLMRQGYLVRRTRPDGLIGNYTLSANIPESSSERQADSSTATTHALSEDGCKEVLADWLREAGWQVTVAMGHASGIDIEAVREGQRWIIEVKGPGSRQPMRVNYFLSILGETLQRMSDPDAHYSIAFPDIRQYRGLWQRLPDVAKQRTGITLLLVSAEGRVHELDR